MAGRVLKIGVGFRLRNYPSAGSESRGAVRGAADLDRGGLGGPSSKLAAPCNPTWRSPPSPLLERIKELGDLFLTRFLEVETGRYADNVDALAELGHAYTRLGRLEEGLSVDQRLVQLIPHNATAHYNMACSLALLDRRDEAIDALEAAIERGYEDAEFMQRDQDLSNVWNEARFRELVERLETHRSS